MSGDYSKDGFDALRDMAGVFLQQGRPVLDSDWNEMVRIIERRVRSETVDTIGRAVVPRETPLGFEIRTGASGNLEIGRGRMYLDGLQLNCHGAVSDSLVFDRARPGTDGPEGVLDEMISEEDGDFLPYGDQPNWPTLEPLPEEGGPHLVYVVAWQREVTPLEAPELLEPALGGIDSTTRWQTVWQVRVLPEAADDLICATPDGEIPDWEALTAPSTARLTTDTVDVEDPEDPCLVPPTDGYTGLENQFYRVQLHSVGADQGAARFKFSRENASVAAAIESIAAGGDRITVRRIGRDQILRFNPGDWVEVTDDHREFDNRSGQMLLVSVVHEETRVIELEGTLDADLVPSGFDGDTLDARHSRIFRWDQRGIIRTADGDDWVDLDVAGSDGLIPVPADDTALVLESGITVSFATSAGPGGFRELDAWSFAARTAGTQVEILVNAPPHSIQRHYARLAVVTFPNTVEDCRIFWPPQFGGSESCGCTVCVTPEDHNSGALTIQAAIAQLGAGGGTVCLSGGSYSVSEPIRIEGRTAITLSGQGLATALQYSGSNAALSIAGSIDVQIERLSIIVRAGGPNDDGALLAAGGISATNTAFLALRRVAVLVVAPGEARQEHGIALEGLVIGAKIQDCLVVAPVALGSPSALDDQQAEGPGFVALAELRVLDSILFGTRAALRMAGIAVNVAGVTIARNLLFGLDEGVRLNWFSAPGGWIGIESNTILSNGDAALLGVSDLRLQDNEISGGPQNGSGLRLLHNVGPDSATDAQIVGNRIGDLGATGLRIEGRHGALLIKRNVFRRCGAAGIATTAEAVIDHIAVDNNVIEDIGGGAGLAEAAGVVLTRAATAQIAANRIRDVARDATEFDVPGSYAGIAVQGCGSVQITQNAIAGIGPDNAGARSVAILARPPFPRIAIRANQIDGAATLTDARTAWMALDIGSPGDSDDFSPEIGFTAQPAGVAAAVPGIAPEALAFATLEGSVLTLSSADFFAMAERRQSQITVESNQIYHAAPPLRPLVLVADSSSLAVAFHHNQCELAASVDIRAIVIIGAPRITASANVIRHRSDAVSMLLSIGRTGAATPIGNITRVPIEIVPTGLNPPFDTLNLIQ